MFSLFYLFSSYTLKLFSYHTERKICWSRLWVEWVTSQVTTTTGKLFKMATKTFLSPLSFSLFYSFVMFYMYFILFLSNASNCIYNRGAKKNWEKQKWNVNMQTHQEILLLYCCCVFFLFLFVVIIKNLYSLCMYVWEFQFQIKISLPNNKVSCEVLYSIRQISKEGGGTYWTSKEFHTYRKSTVYIRLDIKLVNNLLYYLFV